MFQPRVLVLDLDGTTLAAGRRLLPGDVAAARALARHGVSVTIATGRLFPGTVHTARTLGVRGSVAVANGAELVDAQTGQTRRGLYLDRATRRLAREVLVAHGLAAFLFGSRRIHLDRRDARHAHYLSAWSEDMAVHRDVFTAEEWEDAEDIVAVCAAGDEEPLLAARDALHRRLSPDFLTVQYHTFDGDWFLEIRTAREDKGTALCRLAEERECAPEECVAVGDWDNDVPMLEAAGLSFAMAHASELVKGAADEVLASDRTTGGAVAEVASRVWGIEAPAEDGR